MADKKTNAAEKMVVIKLPKNPDPRAPKEEFYSHNFKNYTIKRGESVEVPEYLANLIEDNEQAVQYADKYAEKHTMREV